MENSEQSPADSKKNSTRWLFVFLVFVIVLVLVIQHFSGIGKDLMLLKTVEPSWLAMAIGAQLLTYLFTALSYRILLSTFRLARLPDLPEMISASVVSLFFNQTLPSAGISGNAFFFRYLSRFDIPFRDIIFLILAELLIFYAAILTLILLPLVACILFYTTSHLFTSTLAIGFLVYSVFSIFIILISQKNLLSRLHQKAARIRFVRKLMEKAEKTMSARQFLQQDVPLTELLRSKKSAAWKVYGLELLILAADALTIDALFHGLGIQVSFFTSLLGLICTQIVSLVPFLPGSLVLYESSMSVFFVNLHVPVGSAIVVTLLYRLLSFWLPMPLGLLFYHQWMRSMYKPKPVKNDNP